MRTPITSRKCALKSFYVFFKLGGAMAGQCAEIQARSHEKAKYLAWEKWGHEVAGVYADKEQAEAKAKAFKLKRI